MYIQTCKTRPCTRRLWYFWPDSRLPPSWAKNAILTCSYLAINWDKSEDIFITNILTSVLNFLFSVVTFVSNFIILHAIRKAQDLHSPSFILLCCLAVPDLLVGAICQPSFVAFTTAELVDNFSAFCIMRIFSTTSGYIASGVSLLTLAAVSIDRLLALTLHLRYQTIVTVPRVFLTALSFWIFAITCVVLKFWLNDDDWILLPLVIFLLTLIAITSSTMKIFQIVRRHQRQINDQNMAALSLQTNTVSVLKCKKSAVTVLYVYGLFLVCYLPFCVTILVRVHVGYTAEVKIAYSYSTTAVYINSFLNHWVYKT